MTMLGLTVIYNGEVRGHFEWDKDSVLVGRDDEADIDLSGLGDLKISRSHARINQTKGRYEICDVGAKNFIYLNGIVVTRQELRDADQVNLGNTTLVFTTKSRGTPSEFQIHQGVNQDTLPTKQSAPVPETTYMPLQGKIPDLQLLKISHQRLLALYDLSRQFYTSTSLKNLLQMVLKAVCRLTQAKRTFVALFGKNLNQVDLALGYNMVVGDDLGSWPVSRTIIKRVVVQGKPNLMENAMTDPGLSQVESIKRLQVRSVICYPLIKAEKPIGLIYADNLKKCGVFGKDDLDLFGALSLHVEAAMSMAESRQEVLMSNAQLHRENLLLTQGKTYSKNIIGNSKKIKEVLDRIQDIATIRQKAELCVLITGETGTGKELIAREIHTVSSRKDKPFITVNCAAIPDDLVEAELFGIKEGVATGVSARPGLFKAADKGIIFLDEIADMNLRTQAKVLRAIQNRSFVRVGANCETKVDVWVVAATNKDIKTEIATKNFREDLYYRLKVLEVVLPPLRERDQDIEELAIFFLDKYCREFGKKVRSIDSKAMKMITQYAWPGNVRELENTIAGGVAFCHNRTLKAIDLPAYMYDGRKISNNKDLVSFEEMEKQYLIRVLKHVDWNVSKSARILNIGRQAVYKKIRKYGLEKCAPLCDNHT